ncbi:MAG TPA: helix-turn-helix domain-containing protein [Pyrinomonadaceae bacterium]|nr:helix-turn-helix domain-containing protein [Pyrinomonadaceae bacterium]
MKEHAAWKPQDQGLADEVSAAVNSEELESPNRIDNLKQLTLKLFREVQSLSEIKTVNVNDGLDFYDEVSRFEVELINRALLYTGGHQGRAARLLNLKVTTLNSKIKHYNIKLDAFANGYPFFDLKDVGALQHT